MPRSKALFEGREPGAHAAVVHIAAHLDAHSADERRAVGEGGIESRAIPARQTGLDGTLQIRRQGCGALDGSRVPGKVEFHQTPKVPEDGRTIALAASDDELHHVPDTG